jgi:hypothetical protein
VEIKRVSEIKGVRKSKVSGTDFICPDAIDSSRVRRLPYMLVGSTTTAPGPKAAIRTKCATLNVKRCVSPWTWQTVKVLYSRVSNHRETTTLQAIKRGNKSLMPKELRLRSAARDGLRLLTKRKMGYIINIGKVGMLRAHPHHDQETPAREEERSRRRDRARPIRGPLRAR